MAQLVFQKKKYDLDRMSETANGQILYRDRLCLSVHLWIRYFNFADHARVSCTACFDALGSYVQECEGVVLSLATW